MDQLLQFLNRISPILNIPFYQVLIAALIVVFAALLRRIFSHWILNYMRRVSSKTKTPLDDTLLEILNPPLSYLILLLGFEIARWVIELENLNPALNRRFEELLQFAFVILVCWIIYRSADVFTLYLERISRRTQTELDDLLAPYLRKVIKLAVIIIVAMKAAEIFLGMTAAALFGLLGGMGLTLGLVFKDIIANWFGCAVIYIDNLFREGDWVQLDKGDVIDADVEEIGIRSTKFRNFDKTVSIVPNAVIANAVVKNWSRMYKRRVSYNFTIDGISSRMLEEVLDGLREILKSDDEVHQEFHMVNFREISGNARVIRIYYFTKTTAWKEHERVREKINLKVLQLFETLKVDRLAYTIVDLSDDRPVEYSRSFGVPPPSETPR